MRQQRILRRRTEDVAQAGRCESGGDECWYSAIVRSQSSEPRCRWGWKGGEGEPGPQTQAAAAGQGRQ
eukprot:3680485-Pyramimonas_sp.AAC.2